MINYAKHDEEFYGLFKLVSGEEIVAKAILAEDEGQTLVYMSNPVVIEIFTKELDEGKVVKGMGFSHWMQMSDEDFFIIQEKDIMSLASLSKEFTFMYEAYLAGKSPTEIADNKKSTSIQTWDIWARSMMLEDYLKRYIRILLNPDSVIL